jgi:hypothetical protein
MVYDEVRQRVVLFGGYAGQHMNDTWEWDGATWLQRNPAASPPARGNHAMVYDAARGRVVLFGGGAGLSYLGDTWVPNNSVLCAERRLFSAARWPARRGRATRQPA